jgi:hypothetical protein
MWLTALGLMIGGLGIFAFTSRRGRGSRHRDLGSMSQQWIAEQKAASR